MSYERYELPEYPLTEDMWDRLSSDERPMLIYGMGNGADKLIRRLDRYGVEAADFFASDGFVRGHSFHGKRVLSFSEAREKYEDFVVLLSFGSNREEVLFLLREMDMRTDFYIPDMPVCKEDEYFDRAFYNEHYEEILQAYNSLSDEDSRNCFSAMVNFKLFGRMKYLYGAFSEKDEMYSLLPRNSIKTMLDLGAYNGDTAREAKEHFPSLERVVAVEADKRNFKKLLKYSEAETDISIETINAAVWSECGVGEFSSSGNRNSSVDSTSSYEHKSEGVALLSVDSLSDNSFDYIKYDVEGAEKEALIGSLCTIKENRPALLVSLYHRSRDLFELINFLARELPDYELKLRRLLCVPAWEINLIALPKS